MSKEDRRLQAKIADEVAERQKAVGRLCERVDALEKLPDEIARLRSQLADIQQFHGEVADLREQLREVRQALEGERRAAAGPAGSPPPAPPAPEEAEPQAPRGLSAVLIELKKQEAELKRVDGALAAVKESQRQAEQRLEGVQAEVAKSVEATASPMAPPSPEALLPGLGDLRGQVAALEESDKRITQELFSVRTVMLEMHVNLPLHAVKASRIALKSTDLTSEERRMALESLEVKEQQIRAEVEAVRERSRSTPPSMRELQQRQEGSPAHSLQELKDFA